MTQKMNKFNIFLIISFISSPLLALESGYIKGVNEEQWKIIKQIGEPLNCENRIKRIENIKNGNLISVEQFENNNEIINQSIFMNDVTILDKGEYKLRRTINVQIGKSLIGKEGVILLSNNTDTAIKNNGSVSNLTIINAKKYGIKLGYNSDTYKIIIKNTGIDAPLNSQGNGLHSSGADSFGNCVVSVESMNGYNEMGSSASTRQGGNADGFTVKYGANNITFVDTHAHHNSDDGYDFWKGGAGVKLDKSKPTIRIFYSSANYNGKNPLTKNGDGNGFKFGSSDDYQKNRGNDNGARLIYGSAACFNLSKGFDRNKTSTKIIAKNLHASGNKKGFEGIPNFGINNSNDVNVIKCN